MGLTTSSICVSCQLEEETFPTFTKLRKRIFGKPIIYASEFTEASASAILRFAFQSGLTYDTTVLYVYVDFLIHDSSINVLFIFVPILSFSALFLFSLFT
jgi:hypothetical protein